MGLSQEGIDLSEERTSEGGEKRKLPQIPWIRQGDKCALLRSYDGKVLCPFELFSEEMRHAAPKEKHPVSESLQVIILSLFDGKGRNRRTREAIDRITDYYRREPAQMKEYCGRPVHRFSAIESKRKKSLYLPRRRAVNLHRGRYGKGWLLCSMTNPCMVETNNC